MKNLRKLFFVFYISIVLYIFIKNGLTGEYEEFGFFTKVFSLPFSLIVYWSANIFASNYLVGLFFGVFFSSILITPILLKSEWESKVLGEKQEEIGKVFRGEMKKSDGSVVKAVEYLSENKINPLAPFISILIIPFLIMRIRGVVSLPLNSNLFSDLNYRFFWFDVREYDQYLIIPLLTALVMFFPVIKGSIFKRKKAKEEKYEQEKGNENPQENVVFAKHLKNLLVGFSFFIVSAVILNPSLGVFIIYNFLFNKTVKKLLDKEIGGGYDGIIQRTGL